MDTTKERIFDMLRSADVEMVELAIAMCFSMSEEWCFKNLPWNTMTHHVQNNHGEIVEKYESITSMAFAYMKDRVYTKGNIVIVFYDGKLICRHKSWMPERLYYVGEMHPPPKKQIINL